MDHWCMMAVIAIWITWPTTSEFISIPCEIHLRVGPIAPSHHWTSIIKICHVNQTQVRRPSMFVQWLQHFFWRPIPRFWLCKPARTHPIRSSVYLCYNRCNGQWDRDARSGKMHDLLWCAHPQVIKLQSRSLAFYRCLFLPPSYSDTSFLVIESSRRIPSSRRIQSKQ